MTKIIGLTGGIGSGKTTAAKIFRKMGVPVYFADDAAKHLMETPPVREIIIQNFGTDVAPNGSIDRRRLAEIVFNDPKKLQELNNIVHPAVASNFREWVSRQNAPYVIKEAAILFESGSYANCDAVITVTAPVDLRIQRVVNRDGVTPGQVMARMQNQWTDEQRIKKSDFIIDNSGTTNLLLQIDELHKILNKM